MSATPAFAEPLHVGRPNISDPQLFLELVEGALDRRWLSNDGPLVRELESAIEARLGVRHCIAITNGTIALEIAIRALGLSGEVIVPSFTFVATPHSLQWQGITPVFADIDADTHCLDPESVRNRITPRTTGIIGVHLWGRPAPVDELAAIAAEHNLQLMFDAAHAFDVSSGGRLVGGFGRAEVLSFHATKFFNSVEGGAIVTNDDEVARRARLMRNFGFAGEDSVVYEGTNGKMTEVCAAMGLANLRGIDKVVAVNHRNYVAYRREFAGIPGIAILEVDDAEESNYQYVVALVGDTCPLSRDDVLSQLRVNNVLARRYFWPGCHHMEPYRTLYPNASDHLPQTERIAAQVIVLPTGTAVDEAAIGVIADIVRSAVHAA